MTTSSTVLNLNLPASDGSDPFSLATDFLDNWAILDAAPGVFICTSGTHPTWSTGQAGRLIFETDNQNILEWDGSAFVEFSIAVSSLTVAGEVTTDTLHVTGGVILGAYTLPIVDGAANQVLQTNGSGVATWETVTLPSPITVPLGSPVTIAGGTTIISDTPAAGTYLVTFQGIINPSGTTNDVGLRLQYNGTQVTATQVPTASATTNQLVSFSAIITANGTDSIDVHGANLGAGSPVVESATGGLSDSCTFLLFAPIG